MQQKVSQSLSIREVLKLEREIRSGEVRRLEVFNGGEKEEPENGKLGSIK
jgi:hypothetical protein